MPAKLEVPSIIEVKEQEQQPTVMTSEEKRVMDVLQTSLKEKYSNLVIERVEIVDGQLNLFGSSSDTAADLAVEVGKVLTREKINLTPNLSGLKMPDAQEIPPGVESAPAPPGADSTTTPPTDVDAPPAPSATGNASARPSEGVPPAPNSKAWVARDTLMLVSGLKWSMQFHLSAVGVSADGA